MAIFDFGRLQFANPPPPGDILWYKAHGFMLYAAFAIFYPMGIFGVKYARYHIKFRHWYQYHWVLQTVGVSLTIGAISIAMQKFEDTSKTTHGCIGFGLTVFILFQPLLALFRPDKGCQWRQCWEYCHWFIGTGGVILGWVNIFKGMDMFFCDWPEAGSQLIIVSLFAVQVSIIGFSYLLFDRCHCEKPDQPCDETKVPLLKNASNTVKGTQFLTKV